ncbi:DUF2721 domain-containing protein [Poseidonibacter lekithochrous]|uniref:DUF2721 domain-containing protein n=1 Tax=Poseidonibacter lekithochrous TaxID=1904463 RepID=UPI0008FC70A5|nr:DUF2721 domain-containing protein [Poseidonibacter lekithochrous]QKJ22666.1 DUF2721 domain-containing membrane protein [Poseidonibacter lekithochrous]
MLGNTHETVNTVSQLIQLAVAPVFLLAGVAGLLNVFTGRLSRIIDKLEKIDNYVANQKTPEAIEKAEEKLSERRRFLTMRMQNTNYAIFFCTTTGLLIALVIVTMFLSSLFDFKDSIFIATLFIIAMISFIMSLLLFLREIYYTTSFIKSKKATLKKEL